MAGFSDRSPARAVPHPSRFLRRLLPAALVLLLHWAPTLATAAPTELDRRIAEIREISRFVPEQALRQLTALAAETALAAPATRGDYQVLVVVATMRSGHNQQALALAEQLLAEGRSRPAGPARDNTLAKGLLSKSYVLHAMGQRRAAHLAALEAEQLAAEDGDIFLRVNATIAAGQSHAEQGSYPAALDLLQQALELARQSGQPYLLSNGLNALCALHAQMKQYDQAFRLLEEALRVAAQIGSPGRMALVRITEFRLASVAGQPQRALRALLGALQMQRQLDARAMIVRTLVNLSDLYLIQRDFPKVIEFARQTLDAAALVDDQLGAATARVNLGQAQIALGRLEEGKKNVQRGLDYYEKAGDQPALQAIYLEYGATLERAGDFHHAVLAYHRERAISDQLFTQRRQKAVYELHERYQADQKKRQIALLGRDNRIKAAELERRRLQQRLWWSALAVLTLATLAVGLLYRRVRQSHARLQLTHGELRQLSARDALTGLYNRRHFQEFMLSPAARQHTPGSPALGSHGGALFLFDVDHFKQINDLHGHAAGDAVLRAVAATLHEVLRDTDMIVRWGGEEFLAYLPALAPGRTEEVARRVLDGMARHSVPWQGGSLSVKMSIGYAALPLVYGGKALPWERVLNLADMALYLAKAHGRHRAYGVRGFAHDNLSSLDVIERDLELAWRAGFVDLSLVEPDQATAGQRSNVLALKRPG